MENLQSTQIIKQVVNFWLAQNELINNLLAKHSYETYRKEVAPSRNSGTFLLGHLIAINDGMIPLLGLGDKLFPDLAPLAAGPESAISLKLDYEQLRKYWNSLNDFLENKFKAMSVSEWLEKHSAVSAADFEKEPLRNKLSILISRAGHESYHRGQLIFLNKKLLAV